MDKSHNRISYDFSHCKSCAATTAAPLYPLRGGQLYRCPACDLHYLDALDDLHGAAATAPLTERLTRLIEGKLADNARLHRARLAFVERHAAVAGAYCLDLGAGVGYYAHLLVQKGATVRGIEPVAQSRAFARQRYGLELSAETIDHPGWQEAARTSFDQVTLWDVIEHVNFPRETLAAAGNVLKPGGWLFLDTPSRDSLYYRISAGICAASQGQNHRLLDTLYSAAPFGHKQIFRPRQLTRLLAETGFEIVTVRGSYPLSWGGGVLNAVFAPLRPHDKIIVACRKAR